nr:lactonase family protein [uncultured Lachnoanaerobaculum sp.]
MSGKYVAYVGSYSYTGKAKGITIYDVNPDKGCFVKKGEVDVDNSSYVIKSRNQKVLYSIADEGIVSFNILPDGGLERLNSVKINGMRGCHLSTDVDDKYIFVSGYHDGKITVLRLHEDGSVGDIVDEVYHKGLGSIAERNFRPHVSCTRTTPDGHFVMAADLGIDQVKIYHFDDKDETLNLVDMISCKINSAPRFFEFSKDGKYLYLMYEMKNVIDVFSYEAKPGCRVPSIEKIQTVPTTGSNKLSELTAATALSFSADDKFIFVSNAGDDSVCLYERDADTGLLKEKMCLPISGEYPKDIAVFSDNKHIASINHESGTITFFKIDYKTGLIVMCANSVKVNQPNCCVIVEV